ncbi:MAG: hypothetical protein KA166_03275 [Saprospiraceae bacterium]|nr:hypothetical protein [Saprospiraceae bacterium]MBP8086318.1 hypothetical protein [Saprospiraceae bacterium]
MKTFLTLAIILCITCTIHGQQMPDTISIVKKQVSRFYYDGQKLKPNQMVALVKPNKEAYNEMLVAKRKYGTSSFFGFVGGFIVGWQFVSIIQKKPAPWEVTAIGVGALIASIPFSSSYSRHAVKAVDLYNSGLQDTSLEYEKLEFGIVGSGVGLWFSF